MAGIKDIKDFTKYPSLSDDDIILGSKTSLNGSDAGITVANFKKLVAQDIKPEIKNGYWWVLGVNTGVLAEGKTPVFRKTSAGLEMKYEGEDETAYILLIPMADLSFSFDDLSSEQVEDLKLKFSDLTDADKEALRGAAFTYDMFTAEQLADLRLTWDKLTPDQKNEIKGERGYSAFEVWTQQEGNAGKTIDDYLAWLRQPATEVASEVREQMVQISQDVITAIKAADTAACNAQDAADELNKVKTAFEEFSRTTVLAESNRVKAEEQRVEIEKLRVDAEAARASAESLREDAEELRDQTETERINAEAARKEAESNRVLVEGLHFDAEAKRAAAELIRTQSEQGRVTEEGKRVEVEKARVTAETLRDQSEKKRDEAEGLRDQAEILRASEEVDRDTAEQERISAETTRVDREDGRIVEEQLRKNAELARKEAEAGRVTAEEEREQNTVQAILDTEEATDNANAAAKRANAAAAGAENIVKGFQSDWNVTDPADPNYIPNKPEIPTQDAVPTGETLSYVNSTGTTINFRIGDEVRVLEDGEYLFYRLYDLVDGIASWQESGSGTALPGNIYLQGANYYNNSIIRIKEGYINE